MLLNARMVWGSSLFSASWFVSCLVGFILAVTPTAAQDKPSVEESLPVPSIELPSIEEVEEKIASLQEDQDLEPNLRSQILESYQKTLESLKNAQDWKQKAATYQTDLDQTPKRSEEIQNELAQPPQAATP